MFSFGAYTVLAWIFFALGAAAFLLEAFALVDTLRRPTQAFLWAGKLTKAKWTMINSVATAIGFIAAASLDTVGLMFLVVIAVSAAGVYLTDVRPKVKDYRPGSGGYTSMGPYGPW